LEGIITLPFGLLGFLFSGFKTFPSVYEAFMWIPGKFWGMLKQMLIPKQYQVNPTAENPPQVIPVATQVNP
jgi:hypothetical protein